jgi:succinate dehydrogenase / fumarate reductase cytochrome b subunit
VKYAWYTGCVAKGGCPELYSSVLATAPRLGMELDEIKEASCCGAGVLSERNPELTDTLNARTFALAEKRGLPLMTICSTCQGVMLESNDRLQNAEYRSQVNQTLAPEGISYSGDLSIKHMLWAIVEDLGIEKLQELLQNPLRDLKVAPFYGCYILRPRDRLGYDERPERGQYLEWVIQALQGEAIDYDGKTKCCGFPIMTMNFNNSISMVADHTIEAKEKDADCMVTPCPLCHLNLDGYQPTAAGKRGRSIDLPVFHLPQLLGLALGVEQRELGLTRNIVSTRPVLEKLALR